MGSMGFIGFSTTRCARLRRSVAALACGASLSLLLAAGALAATPGTLTSSFGTFGSVDGELGVSPSTDSTGGGIAVASNGDIYQVGTATTANPNVNELYVARYSPDGAPDPYVAPPAAPAVTYESVGTSTADPLEAVASPYPVEAPAFIALAANGDPVVVTNAGTGAGGEELVVFEFSSTNGALVQSFNNGQGHYETNLGGSFAAPGGIAIDPNGEIAVTGTVGNAKPLTQTSLFATLLHSDGTLDTSFNSSGQIETTTGAAFTEGTGVIAQSNGDLVFTETGVAAGGPTQIALDRVTTLGVPDTSSPFGTNGVAPVNNVGTAPAAPIPASTVATADGGYAVAYTNEAGQPVVTRLKPDGTVDTSFGTSGSGTATVVGPLSPDSTASGLAMEGDGKLLLSGEAWEGGFLGLQVGPFVARLNSDGSIDSTFGDDGVSVHALPDGAVGTPLAAATTADGQLVLSGADQLLCGCDDSFLQEINLDTAPTLTFSYAPSSVQAGTPVQFAAATAADDGDTLGQVSWDFGTGSFGAASGSDVTHTFTSAGTYTVRAEVTDSYGLTSVSTPQTITVAATPTTPVGSGGGTPPAPIAPSGPPTVITVNHSVITVIAITPSLAKATVNLSCAATTGSCNISARLTTLEHLVAGRAVSLSSGGHGKHTKTVTIGSLKVRLKAGTTRTFTIKLNATGRKLLARFHKIPASTSFTLTTGGSSKTITEKVTIG